MVGSRGKGSFVFYDSFFETLQTLDQEDRESANVLYRAIALYGLYRIEPEDLTNIQRALFAGMRAQLEANWIKYENGKKGADFGKRGGAPNGNSNARKTTPKQPQDNPETTRNVNENVNENGECKGNCKGNPHNPIRTAKRTAFVPPSLDELRAFVSEHGLTNVDAEEFIDYYASNGWRVGKQPMKDWRAAARNWNRRQGEFGNKTTNTNVETKSRYKAL